MISSSICITDNFNEIIKEYKKFKHILAIKWCEANELSIKIEEAQLINSIKSIFDGLTKKQKENKKIKDKNIIRALIATKSLSKFTILNQNQCVDFFSEILNNLPDSIPKRRFFFKCSVKNYNNKTHHLWDNFNTNLYNKFLPKNKDKPIPISSIGDSLIYIDFLIQYAPDFVCLNSLEIFLQLFQIIEKEEYVLDLNYDILKYTNNTIDAYFNQHKYYSNYAIQLLRSIFDKIELIRYQTIKINEILKWKPIKALTVLSVLFEKCPDSFFINELDQIYKFLIGFGDSNEPEIQCLFIRNLIFCSLVKEDADNQLISNVLSFDNREMINVVCGQLQNIKLLIDKNHKILYDNAFDTQTVITVIFNNIDSDNELLKNNAFDLLNSCITFNFNLSNESIFEFDSNFVEKLFQQELNFIYIQIINFLIEADKQTFITNLTATLNTSTFEVLQFLYQNIENKIENIESDDLFNSFIENLPIDERDQIGQAVCTFINDNNENVRQLAPLVAAKLSPHLLFTGNNLTDILRILRYDIIEKVKLSILSCFNDHLNTENFNNYPDLRNEFDQQKQSLLFDILLSDNSPNKVQIETVKLICKLSQFNIFYNEIIEKYMNFFNSFTKKQNGIDNYFIFPKKLALQSEFLPYIFESFPTFCEENYFQSFYNFVLDFITSGICPHLKFKRRLNFELKVTKITYFQRKFFKSIFLSFIKSLQIIHKKNSMLFNECIYMDIIDFCMMNLQEGMNKKETEYILSFLIQIITKIGCTELYVMYNKSDKVNQLFSIVLDTGSRFNSPRIHQLVFKILGFLGAQPPYSKSRSIYEFDDKKHRVDDNLQTALMSTQKEKDRINEIFFTVCFNSVRNILDDESIGSVHYVALESLINILSLCKEQMIGNNLNITLSYFKKMLEKNMNLDKNEFVHLFDLLMFVSQKSLKEKVYELTQIFVDLWDHGSINILDHFTARIEFNLTPCFQLIIPKILNLDDKELAIEKLSIIHKNCCQNVKYNYSQYNIIEILIQIGNEGYFKVFNYLNDLLPKIIDLHMYVQEIVLLFLNYIEKLNQNQSLEIYLKNSIDVIHNLFFNDSEKVKKTIEKFKDVIDKSLVKYPKERARIYEKIKKKVTVYHSGSSSIDSNDSIQPDIKISQSQMDEFEKLITSINDYVNDEVNTLYISQWLNKLILFCIKNSSKKFVRFTYPVAKSNQVLANSLFNIAFYSLCSLYSNRKIPKEISQTFLIVLNSKIASQNCKAILLDLIEFMDRLFIPLFKLEDIKCPLNSIFSNKPPMALRYAIQNFEEKNKFSENNLQLAYLNIGLLDDYKQFSLSMNNENITKSIKNRFKLPIFEGNVEEDHKIDVAISLFQKENWNNFESQIEYFNLKTITHLFRTASLINRFWSDSKIEFHQKILNEINQGFDALGFEGGPHFSQGFSSVLQSIIYGQQFIELKEMFLSNVNNFDLRSQNSSQILSFLPQILMLRITSKGTAKDSLSEKLSLLSLCRKSSRWESMLMYENLFKFNENEVPIEIQYEMMYYKIANNLIFSEQEFNDLIEKVTQVSNEVNYINEEYNKSNLIENIKYQKAVYLSQNQQNEKEEENWIKVISICNEIENSNADSINLLGLANLKLFELTSNGDYLNNSIKNYINSSIKSEKNRISNLLQIIYLLFKHYNDNRNNSMSIESIENEIKKIPFHFYFDVMSQFISYVPLLNENSFKYFIMKLLTQIISFCPESVIYDYSFSIFSDKTIINEMVKNSPITEIMEKTNLPQFNEAIKLTNSLNKANHNFFSITVKFIDLISDSILRTLKNDTFENLKPKTQKIYEMIDTYKKEIITPITNYLSGSIHKNNSYEYCQFELNVIDDFYRESFESFKNFLGIPITSKINRIISLYKSYNEMIKDGNKDKANEIMRSIFNLKMSIKKSFFDYRCILNPDPPDDLYKLSAKIAELKNMKIPVFGTFRYDNGELILIKEFDHFIEFIKSIRKPKKIKIRGSDGNLYPFILKESEDLRTDQRIMIFQRFLNRFLKTKIKTYSIIPLSPQMGIIQFINGQTSIGELIDNYQKRIEEVFKLKTDSITCFEQCHFSSENSHKLSKMQRCEKFVQIAEKTKERENDLKESFWFLTPNSETWFKFFKNFSNFCAVTSIVGYIIGLGDRHPYNMLIDKSEGCLMHIDFCDVFEANQKRKSSPEMVPFRLTRNLVAALGVSGYKGKFFTQCEEALSIIRKNGELIVSILSVFVDSPIFEHRFVDYGFLRKFSEIEKAKVSAEIAMKRIVKKVNGTDTSIILSYERNLDDVNQIQQLSVKEHVQKLIECATNPYHLCGSFQGWKPLR